MFLVNLENMKVDEVYNWGVTQVTLPQDAWDLFGYNLKELQTYAQQVWSGVKLEKMTEYVVNFGARPDKLTEEQEYSLFLQVVNVFIAEFFKFITTTEKRNREYRLDVPPELKVLKTSLSAVKKAINYKTITDLFNVTIIMGDVKWSIADEKGSSDLTLTDVREEEIEK